MVTETGQRTIIFEIQKQLEVLERIFKEQFDSNPRNQEFIYMVLESRYAIIGKYCTLWAVNPKKGATKEKVDLEILDFYDELNEEVTEIVKPFYRNFYNKLLS